MFFAAPASAQRADAPGQLQRADGSTTLGGEAPSNVTNQSFRGGDEVFITHSASQEVTPLTGIACSSAGSTTQNSYWRVFDLDEFMLDEGLTTTSVEIGVETANIFAAPPTSTVRLYSLDGPFTTANLTLVAEGTYDIQGTEGGTIITVPVEGSFAAGSVMAVEWDVPNLQDSGGGVFIGSNTQGQTGPTYVSAADCGLNEPTDLASIGFPDVAWVLNVNGTAGGDGGGGNTGLEEAIHDTGLVQFEVYADGNLGTMSPDPFSGTGFVYDGVNASGNGGLFAATFLVGASVDQVSGTPYETGDWVRVDSLREADAPDDFDQAFTAVYDDSGAPNPIGLEVGQYSYSSMDSERDDFVVIEFELNNTSGSDLDGIYAGVFADWDAGTAVANLGGYDEGTSLLYVYDDLGGDSNYYGVVALDDNVSGYNLDAGAGTNPTDEDAYNSMTIEFPIPELPEDRRTILGVGPYDIPAGGSVTVRYAFVGGSDEADIIANANAAQIATDEPLEEAIHDTGLVQFEVYDDGNLGTVSPDPFAGQGFVYDGVNASGNGGLFASTFLVGANQDQVSGTPYETGDWVTTQPLSNAVPPSGFDQAFAAGYDDSGAPLSIGLEIDQFSYSSTDSERDDFVIVEFEVENSNDSELTGIYAGIFADWDAGTAVANLGGYDEGTSLLYVYDDLGGDSNYYGVVALDGNVSGYNLDAGAGTNPTDEDAYNSMTIEFPIPELPEDRRAILGVGPYDIPAGESVTVRFAYVGGSDLDNIIANAQAARNVVVATEESTPEGTFVLESAYPNPFTSATTIGFTLPTAQDVELTVYDILGRRVATLVDGVRQAGEQSVRFDASQLPSGVYIYRLQAGGTSLTQRITLVR